MKVHVKVKKLGNGFALFVNERYISWGAKDRLTLMAKDLRKALRGYAKT